MVVDDDPGRVNVDDDPSESVVVTTDGTTGPGAVGLGRMTPPERSVTVTIPEDTVIG